MCSFIRSPCQAALLLLRAIRDWDDLLNFLRVVTEIYYTASKCFLPLTFLNDLDVEVNKKFETKNFNQSRDKFE